MYCPQQITHVIRRGDSLYQLAKRYNTTVSDIMELNPGLNPYNLVIGTSLIICPGGTTGEPPQNQRQIELIKSMRLAWSQHVYWTRMLLISIADKLKDEDEVRARLLENPADIAQIFALYYPTSMARAIEQLLTEHLAIGDQLIHALRDQNTQEAERLTRQWYANADQMARAFSQLNPFYKYEDVKRMLDRHLELTTQEVAMRLAGNYKADIAAFDQVEDEAMKMADYFSSGIMQQFPNRF